MSRVQLIKKKHAWRLPDKAVDHEVVALFNAFMDDLGCSFRARSSKQLRRIIDSWESMPHDFSYVDPLDFFKQYAPKQFFKKYFFDYELDQTHLQDSARASFIADVEHGHRMNQKLKEYQESLPLDSWFMRVIAETREIIRSAVGDDLPIREIFEGFKHGPNATTNVKRDDAYIDRKHLNPSGSSAVASYWATYCTWNTTLQRECVRFGERPFIVQRWNKLSFVPKDCKKLRTMSVEPTTSMGFQLSYGEWLAERLFESCNIDISTQPDCHRLLVRIASLLHELGIATLDWSKASDRIWIVLIELLFPEAHYKFMMHIRSSHALVDGEEIRLPMMGTMGNGFTFPLQTLVFYALLTALCRVHGIDETVVSTFGDDCIVPTSLLTPVKNLADILGWQLNEEKSFFDGGFRESCGADMYRGVGVRPFYIKRPDNLRSKNSIKAWSYVCYNQISDCLKQHNLKPTKSLIWLLNFHKKYELGKVLVVPPRYGEGSGCRVTNSYDLPDDVLQDFWLPRYVKVRDRLSVFADYQIQFRCLSNDKRFRSVCPGPFYANTLEGKLLPQEFRKGKIMIDDDVDIPWTGEQPLKAVKYVHKTSRIHNWNYFMSGPFE